MKRIEFLWYSIKSSLSPGKNEGLFTSLHFPNVYSHFFTISHFYYCYLYNTTFLCECWYSLRPHWSKRKHLVNVISVLLLCFVGARELHFISLLHSCSHCNPTTLCSLITLQSLSPSLNANGENLFFTFHMKSFPQVNHKNNVLMVKAQFVKTWPE